NLVGLTLLAAVSGRPAVAKTTRACERGTRARGVPFALLCGDPREDAVQMFGSKCSTTAPGTSCAVAPGSRGCSRRRTVRIGFGHGAAHRAASCRFTQPLLTRSTTIANISRL